MPDLLPADDAAEMAVLGSLLLDASIDQLSLVPEDFHDDQNREVYAACLKVRNAGQSINSITVAHALGERLEHIGGAAYLVHLLSGTPTPMGIESYAEIVKKTSLQRRMIAAGEEISKLGHNGGDTARAWKILRQLEVSKESGTPADLAETALSLLKPQEAAAILHLPWYSIEQLTGPLSPGQVWIFGARTSVGKTTALLTIAVSLAQMGKSILYATAEELSKEVVLRVGAMTEGLNIRAVAHGAVSTEAEDQLMALSGWLSVHHLYIPHLSRLADIERWAYKVKSECGLDAVFVDYIQRFLSKGDKRYEETTQLSNRLKTLAGEWGVPVIAASQFSRGIEQRAEKEPNLGDLRDSGAIEEDADVAILLYRAKDKEQRNPKTKFIVAKNRLLGQLATIELEWDMVHRAYKET
jgi:replicative DNA helicase